jgi:hypothetical protein
LAQRGFIRNKNWGQNEFNKCVELIIETVLNRITGTNNEKPLVFFNKLNTRISSLKKSKKLKKIPAFSYHNKNHLLKLFEKVNEYNEFEKTKHKKYILELKKICKNKIIFFGSGGGAKDILKYFPLPVQYIVDNNQEKWGTKMEGIPICSPDKLLAENKDALCIIVTIKSYEIISNQLQNMGFLENIHFKNGINIFHIS